MEGDGLGGEMAGTTLHGARIPLTLTVKGRESKTDDLERGRKSTLREEQEGLRIDNLNKEKALEDRNNFALLMYFLTLSHSPIITLLSPSFAIFPSPSPSPFMCIDWLAVELYFSPGCAGGCSINVD